MQTGSVFNFVESFRFRLRPKPTTKKRCIVGLVTLLTLVVLFAWRSFPGPSAEMDADPVISNAMTEGVTSSTVGLYSQRNDSSAFVRGCIIFLIIGLIWHLLAFIVWNSKSGRLYRKTHLSKCAETKKPVYSDDEESLMGSPTLENLETQNCVRAAISQYNIAFLLLPISIIWRKVSIQKPQRIEPRGLKNLGNTCYFNSVMQILANTYILHTCIQENKYSGKFNRHFERFCKWTIKGRSGSSSRWNVWNLLSGTIEQFVQLRGMHKMFSSRCRRFSDHGQHDSHECLRHFLDELRKDERDLRKKSMSLSHDEKKELTVVDKVFGGHFITVYSCKKCGSPYHLFEPFLDISLPVCLGLMDSDQIERDSHPERNLHAYAKTIKEIMKRLSTPALDEHPFSQSQYSIRDCLLYYTRTEHIRDDYLCNYCYSMHAEHVDVAERLTSATKQTLIFNPPAVLTIHMKRFELMPGRSEKRRDKIRYEELLDIAPYCSASCLRSDHQGRNIWYSLYGIVVHSGSLECGHYFAYIKVRRDEPYIRKYLQQEYFDRDKTKDELIDIVEKTRRNKARESDSRMEPTTSEGIWYCMNDDSVSEVTIDEVLNQEAYLLLYERI